MLRGFYPAGAYSAVFSAVFVSGSYPHMILILTIWLHTHENKETDKGEKFHAWSDRDAQVFQI